MIKGLMYKEIWVLKKILLLYFIGVCMFLIPDLIFELNSAMWLLGGWIPGGAGLLVLESFNGDEKAGWTKTLLGLQVKRSLIVYSKYCIALCPLLVLPIVVMVSLPQPTEVLIVICSHIFVIVFLLPTIIRFGRICGAVTFAASMAVVILTQHFLLNRFLKVIINEEELLEWHTEGINSVGYQTVAICVVLVIMLFLSVKASTLIMEKTDY